MLCITYCIRHLLHQILHTIHYMLYIIYYIVYIIYCILQITYYISHVLYITANPYSICIYRDRGVHHQACPVFVQKSDAYSFRPPCFCNQQRIVSTLAKRHQWRQPSRKKCGNMKRMFVIGSALLLFHADLAPAQKVAAACPVCAHHSATVLVVELDDFVNPSTVTCRA